MLKVWFSLIGSWSVNETMLSDLVNNITNSVRIGMKSSNEGLVNRSRCIMLWLPKDTFRLEMMHSAKLQQVLRTGLDKIIDQLPNCSHSSAAGQALKFAKQLLESNLVTQRKFAEGYVQKLVPMLQQQATSKQVRQDLLSLLTDILRHTPVPSLMGQPSFEEKLGLLLDEAVAVVNCFNASSSQSVDSLAFSLQILQNILF